MMGSLAIKMSYLRVTDKSEGGEKKVYRMLRCFVLSIINLMSK